jgi:type VI protein secretion system component VasK
LLEQRLNDRLVERLQNERDPQRRDLIYTFPQQFGSLKQVADRFLKPKCSGPAASKSACCCGASTSPAAPRKARRSTG